MATNNNSYSIPQDEFLNLEKIKENCRKVIDEPNRTEIVRVAIYNLREKKPQEISETLSKIGRKSKGRERKEVAEETTENGDVLDFSNIPEARWKLVKDLFSSDTEARDFLSDILFDLQNAWKRGVKRQFKTNKTTRWRRLQTWQENGVWNEIYKRLSETYTEKQIVEWKEIFLKSFLLKRKKL